ncbi:hypothetical protein BGX31_004499, partial [Mortierella sp. GBA43]
MTYYARRGAVVRRAAPTHEEQEATSTSEPTGRNGKATTSSVFVPTPKPKSDTKAKSSDKQDKADETDKADKEDKADTADKTDKNNSSNNAEPSDAADGGPKPPINAHLLPGLLGKGIRLKNPLLDIGVGGPKDKPHKPTSSGTGGNPDPTGTGEPKPTGKPTGKPTRT